MSKLIFAAAVAASLLTTTAQAATAIKVGDLDLSKPSAARKLEARIGRAARHVCGSELIRLRSKACRTAVLAEANQKLAGLKTTQMAGL